MNRIFPGKSDGTVTEKIADYFLNNLVPEADIVLDFHSGGKTLDFIPFAAAHFLDDAEQEKACFNAMRAFNAPYSMALREIDDVGMYDTAVENAGKVFVSTELGGGGSITARSARIAKKGAVNLLKHAGIMSGAPEVEPSVEIDSNLPDCFHFSEHEGLLEPMADLGDPIKKGDVLANIWSTCRTGEPPVEVRSMRDGILAARHFPGLLNMGDCLAVVAKVMD